MAILDELVSQIDNPDLRARIAAEVEKLAKQKKFGLVFEEHLPECTPLYEIPVKAGATVALKAGQVNDVYGSVIAENAETKKMLPRTQWSFKTHNARDYGSKIVKSLLGSGRFDFPKSLYAVRDTIRYLLWNKPDR